MNKEKLKIINRVTILLLIIGFILDVLLNQRTLFIIICLGIILFIWGLYIYLYPKAYFIEPRNPNSFRLPWIGIVASSIILMVITNNINFYNNYYFISIIPLSILLLIPFFIKFFKSKKRDIRRLLLVFIASVCLASSISIPFNSLLPIVNTTRVKSEVLSKSYANASDTGKHFELYLKVNGKAKRFTVSKSKYKHTKENDIVLIEKRENIFGMIFYNIY